MGKASSSKKVARAAKAAGRPGAKKSYAWPTAIGAVVVAGVVLIVASFGGSSDNEPPRIGDHWHAAYGVYNCDAYLAPFGDEAGDRTGIHTHQDGLMHMHPFASRVTGEGANLAAFGEDVGMDIDDDSLDGPGIDVENGDECGGEPATVRLLVWDNPGDAEPQVITEDIADHDPDDGSVWALVFAPDDAEVPIPNSALNLADPLAAEQGRQPPTATSLPTEEPAPAGDESTSTTAPAEGEGSTPTPDPEGSTSTTAAP